MSDSPAYWLDIMGSSPELKQRSFKILPLVGGAFALSIDGQWTSFFGVPEDAAAACANGHVATFVIPINPERRPELVKTSEYPFPTDLSGWNRYALPMQEFLS